MVQAFQTGNPNVDASGFQSPKSIIVHKFGQFTNHVIEKIVQFAGFSGHHRWSVGASTTQSTHHAHLISCFDKDPGTMWTSSKVAVGDDGHGMRFSKHLIVWPERQAVLWKLASKVFNHQALRTFGILARHSVPSIILPIILLLVVARKLFE